VNCCNASLIILKHGLKMFCIHTSSLLHRTLYLVWGCYLKQTRPTVCSHIQVTVSKGKLCCYYKAPASHECIRNSCLASYKSLHLMNESVGQSVHKDCCILSYSHSCLHLRQKMMLSSFLLNAKTRTDHKQSVVFPLSSLMAFLLTSVLPLRAESPAEQTASI